jgi:hypothetical protein
MTAELEGTEELVRPRLGASPREAVKSRQQDEVLTAGQVLVDRGELPGQADPSADAMGLADDVVAEHDGATGIGTEQRREEPHHRRLAGAVGPEQAVDAATTDAEIDAPERLSRAEGLDDARRLDGEGMLLRHKSPPRASGRIGRRFRRRAKQHISGFAAIVGRRCQGECGRR